MGSPVWKSRAQRRTNSGDVRNCSNSCEKVSTKSMLLRVPARFCTCVWPKMVCTAWPNSWNSVVTSCGLISVESLLQLPSVFFMGARTDPALHVRTTMGYWRSGTSTPTRFITSRWGRQPSCTVRCPAWQAFDERAKRSTMMVPMKPSFSCTTAYFSASGWYASPPVIGILTSVRPNTSEHRISMPFQQFATEKYFSSSSASACARYACVRRARSSSVNSDFLVVAPRCELRNLTSSSARSQYLCETAQRKCQTFSGLLRMVPRSSLSAKDSNPRHSANAWRHRRSFCSVPMGLFWPASCRNSAAISSRSTLNSVTRLRWRSGRWMPLDSMSLRNCATFLFSSSESALTASGVLRIFSCSYRKREPFSSHMNWWASEKASCEAWRYSS
eukprot:PhM_4_TR4613/c0_g1_i1/m.95154